MLLPTRRERIVVTRPPIARPSEHAATTFACPGCDLVLWDEVAYMVCPVCDLPVDWVDVTLPIWCCPSCDAIQNQQLDAAPHCAACDRPMVRAEVPEPPRPAELPTVPRPPPGRLRRALDRAAFILVSAMLLTAVIAPLLSLALDPAWRNLALALAAPIVIVPLTMAGMFLWSLGTSFDELRALARDRTTRIIHGLEHATAHVLERDGLSLLGGLTHAGHFDLFVPSDSANRDQPRQLRNAANEAIRRIRDGERHLAFHPRCGTSILVTVLLVALGALGSGIVGLFLHLRPGTLLGIGGGLVLLIVVGARPLGLLAQRFLTVSTRLRSARVLRIVRRINSEDCVHYEVHLAVRPRA